MMTPVALITGSSDGRNVLAEPGRGSRFDPAGDRAFVGQRRVAAGDRAAHRRRRLAQGVHGRGGAESRFERAHRRPLPQLLDGGNQSEIGHCRLQIADWRFRIANQQSAPRICNLQSEICNLQDLLRCYASTSPP